MSVYTSRAKDTMVEEGNMIQDTEPRLIQESDFMIWWKGRMQKSKEEPGIGIQNSTNSNKKVESNLEINFIIINSSASITQQREPRIKASSLCSDFIWKL